MKYIDELIIKLGNWIIKHNIYTLTDDEKYKLKQKAENTYLAYKKQRYEELLNNSDTSLTTNE